MSASANTMFGLLPPSSRLTRFKLVRPAASMMRWPTSVDPVKATLSISMWFGDRRARGGTVAGQDVYDARREAGFENEFTDLERGERRLLGGFEHHRVAHREGRPQLHAVHQQREVPGRDLADDSYRLVPGVAEVVPVDRDGLAMIFVGPSGVVSKMGDREREARRRAQWTAACRCRASPSAASSSASRSIRSASRFIRRPRSEAEVRRHGPTSNALRAAATALSTSAESASAICAISAPVAGLKVRNVFPDSLSIHWLLTSSFAGVEIVRNSGAGAAIVAMSDFSSFS